jgi:hypothetical protein
MKLLSLLLQPYATARLPACLGLAAQPAWTRAGAIMLAAHLAEATWPRSINGERTALSGGGTA